MDKPTFDVQEAAEFLKCHPETVRELIRARKLIAAKVGRRFVIRRQVLDAYLEDKENDAVQASAQNRSRKICLNDKTALNRESTNATVLGILTSGQKAAKELDALLAHKTVKKPKRCANN
ncbi:helix-turn-helix domain-containing protein [Neisseria iguanae]|uniref:XRE family transcriptional regulator n=1 Tax=Neisseria iguanae TaxID=90242 RepID=A0A2P7U2P7_9NEIS|nr:helix-turn-helix domain-containing protein [Neisseria iguanae]PSJ81183.1 XRE family transcriptional regulator [Neisseria iguanae]